MPVRKSTPAKKTAKSAAPALAKQNRSAKTTKKSASPKPSSEPTTVPAQVAQFKKLGRQIADGIRSGDFDAVLTVIDDALTERANSLVAQEAAKKSTSASSEKKTSAPPKRTKTVTLTKGNEYKVAASFKKLAGAKVEFQRHKTVDGTVDKTKAVVVMLQDKPGNPKGKRVIVPVSALQ